MIDQVVYYLGNLSPAIQRRLSQQGGADLDIVFGMEFRLRLRERYGDTPLLDAVMEADFPADTLTYEPQVGEIPDEGVYRGWIVLDLGDGVVQDTDEFDLIVLDHAPGEGTRIGAIARAGRAMVPIAWDSVRGIKDYGDVELQRQIELAKLRVLRVPTNLAAENSLDPRVVDYIAKKVLVDSVLEAAISFWMNEVLTRTARGNSDETESYPDRIRATENQLERFEQDLLDQLAEVEEIIGIPTGPVQLGPDLYDHDELITPGLETFPSPHASPWPYIREADLPSWR